MNKEDLCTRCGLCCILQPNSVLEVAIDCRNLKRLGDGTTICKIYGNHKGTKLGYGYVCVDIMDDPKLYDDCPYNDLKIAERLSDD